MPLAALHEPQPEHQARAENLRFELVSLCNQEEFGKFMKSGEQPDRCRRCVGPIHYRRQKWGRA